MRKLLILLLFLCGCQTQEEKPFQKLEGPGLKSYFEFGNVKLNCISHFDGKIFTFRCSQAGKVRIPELEEIIAKMPKDKVTGSIEEGELRIDFSGMDVKDKFTDAVIRNGWNSAGCKITIFSP